MRYVSEQFKEKQNQVIRPPLKIYFEVATNITNILPQSSPSTIVDNMEDLDRTVAPALKPVSCLNQYYYAVIGDGVGVDDPNRICSPDNSGGSYASPTHTVPLGISKVAAVNEEILIGSKNAAFSYNIVFSGSITLSFKGGLIPEEIRVERYIFSGGSYSWVTVATIDNSELAEEVEYVNTTGTLATNFHRFWLKNTTKSGRYQVNWIRRNTSTPVSFENNYVVSVSDNEAIDLTSQSLPSYEMTVDCLDPNGQYSLKSSYWNRQFAEGSKCYLKVGYEIGGVVEFVSILFGALTKKPKYEQNKISFSVEVERLTPNETYYFASYPLASGVGVSAYDYKLSDRMSYATMFSVIDIFRDTTDRDNSVSNAYFATTKNVARQLIANALGGYIKYGFNTIELHNTVDVQYKNIEDYLTRYNQVKNTLDSQLKVGKISVTRNENKVSANYVDIEASERISLTGGASAVEISYPLPSFPCGRLQVLDYQSSVVSANITRQIPIGEKVNSDGTPIQSVGFKSDVNTTVKPIVRFYQVDNSQYEENETIDSNSTEDYTNNNELITNNYIANKAKNVAKMISDMSNQYEVDVIQDLRYELGDVIRLETEKNVFKTCVITALQFKLPGSNGHITCRKIFNIADSGSSLYDVDNSHLAKNSSDTPRIKVTGTENGNIVVGKLTYSGQPYFFILGATGLSDCTYTLTTVSDDNSHDWKGYSTNVQGLTYTCPVIDLGAYNSAKESDYKVYGIKTLLLKLYAEQNMIAPIKYTNP